MKKCLCAILILALLLTLAPALAGVSLADDTNIRYPVEGGNIYFDKTTGTIVGADFSLITSANIPASIGGVAVTAIGDEAFSLCTSLANVSIPDSVTSIGESAFSWCSALTSITIPASVTEIGEDAFLLCTSLTDIYFGGTEEQWRAALSNDDYFIGIFSPAIHYNSAPTPAPAPAATPYSDVSADYWGIEAINFVTDNGIMKGIEPAASTSRVMYATFIMRAYDLF